MKAVHFPWGKKSVGFTFTICYVGGGKKKKKKLEDKKRKKKEK